MQGLIIVVLTLTYILVAYVGPVAAFGLSVYWAYEAYNTGSSFIGAFVTFLMSLLIMVVGLWILKRVVKWLMNKVDLDEEGAPE